MLAVMLFIANHDDETFSTSQFVAATGVDNMLVHPLLARLKKGQVIEQIGRVPGERTLLFRRIESPYWDLARRRCGRGTDCLLACRLIRWPATDLSSSEVVLEGVEPLAPNRCSARLRSRIHPGLQRTECAQLGLPSLWGSVRAN